MTVHRDKFLIIKPIRCTYFSNLFLEWNSTCFGQFLCPSSGVFHCTHSNGICHTVLLTACEQDRDGTAFHPDPARKLSAKLYDIIFGMKLFMNMPQVNLLAFAIFRRNPDRKFITVNFVRFLNISPGAENPGRQIARATGFYRVAPPLCGSAVWNFLYVTHLTPRTLRWLLDFGKNLCTLAVFSPFWIYCCC